MIIIKSPCLYIIHMSSHFCTWSQISCMLLCPIWTASHMLWIVKWCKYVLGLYSILFLACFLVLLFTAVLFKVTQYFKFHHNTNRAAYTEKEWNLFVRVRFELQFNKALTGSDGTQMFSWAEDQMEGMEDGKYDANFRSILFKIAHWI